MPLSREEWHQRFEIQARWTEGLRLYFFELLKKDAIHALLDIGCGTGALLPDLEALSPGLIFGADININHLQLANRICPDCFLSGGDVHQLPFADNAFDIVLSHFFLLWISNPHQALQEMRRVTRPGGTVVAFAEPDYGGRIDHPEYFHKVRKYQIQGLLKAGADPQLGRKLNGLFLSSGFSDVECGVYQGLFPGSQTQEEFNSEWKVLSDDLTGILPANELEDLRIQELRARENGTRLIYVPTFYAWGKVVK